MKKENIISTNIGDILYKYVTLKGIFTYKVIGKREYKDNVQYEVECQQCRDHLPCHVLVTQVDNKPCFQYVSMVDEDEDYEQYYWNTSVNTFKTEYYFKSLKDCKIDLGKGNIKNIEKEIEELEEKLKKAKFKLTEQKALIDALLKE